LDAGVERRTNPPVEFVPHDHDAEVPARLKNSLVGGWAPIVHDDDEIDLVPYARADADQSVVGLERCDDSSDGCPAGRVAAAGHGVNVH
jgi:hypothetical protein